MKRYLRLAVITTTLFALIGGCTGTVGPSGSATAPLATTTPNLTAGTTPFPSASAAPGPTLIPYPGPSIPPGTLTIEIAAIKTLAFDRDALAAPANTPFVIAFDNRDTTPCTACNGPASTGQSHNVAIKLGGVFLFNPLPAIEAPAKVDYFISGGLPAGTYQFLCTVHPTMGGTLTIT